MKKLKLFTQVMLLCFATTIMFSCTSREEKANRLIKEDMFRTLFDFASYEPIETKIDSAFTSVFRDAEILGLAYVFAKFLDENLSYRRRAQSALRSMEIWSDSRTPYGRTRFNRASDEVLENLEKATASLEKASIARQLMRDKILEFTPEFIGWQATHRFRSRTRGGHFTIGNFLYVFNPEITEIIHKEDLDDEEKQELRAIIADIKEGALSLEPSIENEEIALAE